MIEKSATGWRCRLGRHAYASRRDDNSETPGRTIRVCIVCGKYFEPEDEPERILWLSPAGTASVLVYQHDDLKETRWGAWLHDLFAD